MSALLQLMERPYHLYFGQKKRRIRFSSRFTEYELSELARDVAQVYERNAEFIRSVAREYGFTPLFYWQPTVFNKTYPSAYERRQQEDFEYLRGLYQMTTEFIRASDRLREIDGFSDLSGHFAGDPSPLFIDWMHMGEPGARRIGEVVAGEVLGRLSQEE